MPCSCKVAFNTSARSLQNKIQFAEAALTKDQIKDEIIEEFKAAVFENINNTKGNLSKALVCAIISETVLNKTSAECVDEVKI